MKGTDLTREQLDAAGKFFSDRITDDFGRPPIFDDDVIPITYGNLKRMIAWYGALRYESGRNGVNDDPTLGEYTAVR